MEAALRALVRERAGNRCEYCRIHQDQDAFFKFPVDHIIALQHGGKTESDNLCLSCYRCNSHKGPNIASIDPETRDLVRLFLFMALLDGDRFEGRFRDGVHTADVSDLMRRMVKEGLV